MSKKPTLVISGCICSQAQAELLLESSVTWRAEAEAFHFLQLSLWLRSLPPNVFGHSFFIDVARNAIWSHGRGRPRGELSLVHGSPPTVARYKTQKVKRIRPEGSRFHTPIQAESDCSSGSSGEGDDRKALWVSFRLIYRHLRQFEAQIRSISTGKWTAPVCQRKKRWSWWGVGWGSGGRGRSGGVRGLSFVNCSVPFNGLWTLWSLAYWVDYRTALTPGLMSALNLLFTNHSWILSCWRTTNTST